MTVIELLELSDWFKRYYKELIKLMNALHGTLSNNISQPTQQPIEEHLTRLSEFLAAMRTDQLSLQQLKLLDALDVGNLVGENGAQHVEVTVKTSSYDPASTERKINAAIKRLNDANQKLEAYSSAVRALGLEPDTFEEVEGRVIVRIGFKGGASIDNVVDWKKSSEDWHHIIRGIALAVGEAPENTRIIGASKGSVILIMAATYICTKILAVISKHITSIAKDMIDIASTVEDLKQKKLLTKTMEAELDSLKNGVKDKKLSELRKEVKALLPKPKPGHKAGDAEVALDKSIDRLLAFGEAGGDIDFVSPADAVPSAEATEQEPDALDRALAEVNEVRGIIHEYQETREAVRLLENKRSE